MHHFVKGNFGKVLLFTLYALVFFPLKASPNGVTLQEFIEKYSPVAMEEMRRHGIPASIKLAQGILESGFGNSELAVNANNHFGIKCHGWGGGSYLYDDDARNECFRLYDDPKQSWLDHSQFLLTRPRYAFLFELDIMDYKGWARGLRKAGYATNPRYPQLLTRIIEEHRLTRFDQKAMDMSAQRPANMPRSSSEGNLHTGKREDFAPVPAPGPRKERNNNRIRYVYAREGDTPESLAEELDMWTWQITRYNELEDGRQIRPGQIVYLQPKRRRGEESYHITRRGETMYDISQQYGVRLRHLYRRNVLEPGEEPKPGQKILLRGRAR